MWWTKNKLTPAEQAAEDTRRNVERLVEQEYKLIKRFIKAQAAAGLWCLRTSCIHPMNGVRLRAEGFDVGPQGISWELP